ncbi:MAG: adenine phosphoribosyltransferase [Planctomycetota bacterium]
MLDLNAYIRDVPDFPKPGIVFKDITPLLRDPAALAQTLDALAESFTDAGISRVAGIESRGFIFGVPLALRMGCGFVPLRKPGKLPWTCSRREYELEYGRAALEVHADAVDANDRVLLVDDLLATGGTMAAGVHLIEALGATVVGASVVIELAFLDGREKVSCPVHALLTYA